MFKKRDNIKEVEEGKYLAPKFDKNGLIPVITTSSFFGIVKFMFFKLFSLAPVIFITSFFFIYTPNILYIKYVTILM